MKSVATKAEPRVHRYRVGQQVALSRGFGYARKIGALYEIVRLLPADQTHFQYRIRSQAEAYERVASENELTPPRQHQDS